MIALESLGCAKPPPLRDLNATFSPGELVAICGGNTEERAALVELLAGYRAEDAGAFLADGVALGARERREAVAVLPRSPALSAELSVADHVRLVSRLRGRKVGSAALAQALAFARIDTPRRKPADLSPEAQLRFTVALCVLTGPKLALALEPPPELVQLMAELAQGGCPQVAVAERPVGLEAQVGRALGLEQGTLSARIEAPEEGKPRAFALRLAHGAVSLETLLSTQGGVGLDRLGDGRYRLQVEREVALAPLLRMLVSAGVVFESVALVAEARGR